MHTKSLLEHEEAAPLMPGPSRTFEDLMSHPIATETAEYELWIIMFREFAFNSKISDERYF